MSPATFGAVAVLVMIGFGAIPTQAQTVAEAQTAALAPTLDLTPDKSEAVRAAKAAQAGETSAHPAAPVTATPAFTSADTVESLTVSPASEPKAQVVASTDATSLASPNFSAKDAQPTPLAVGAGANKAVGAQSVENTHVAGFLKVNPQGGATRKDVGLTDLF